MRIRSLVIASAITVSLLSTVTAQGAEKVTMLVGEWAVGPLTPWVEEFTKSTGIEVDLQGFPFRDLLQTIEVRAKARADDVDVIFVDAPLVPSYAVRGIIAPMTPYMADVDPAKVWASASIDAGSWKGELWAPPLNNSEQLLFFNRDLLSAAGVSEPSSDPTERLTWEELADNAKKIVDVQNGVWGMTFDQVSRYYQLQALPESLGGGSGVDAAGTSVKGALTNESWIKAATFYYDTFNTWNIAPKGVSPAETAPLFAAGKVGYFVGGPWNVGPFVKSGVNFGVALHPYFEGGVPATGTNSWHVGVFNYSTNKEAASKLALYLTTSSDVAIAYLEGNGDLPANLAALKYIEDTPKYQVFPETAYQLASYEAANTAVTRARTPAFLEFEEIVNNSFEDIRNGADPSTVLGEAEVRIDAAMRRYQ